MKKLPIKLIPEQYFNELKNSGSTVPRYKETKGRSDKRRRSLYSYSPYERVAGEVIPFRVGATYSICYVKGGEMIKAICTQNCPYHLKKID